MVKKLTQRDVQKRAKRIKLVLTDCDGVLTDTGVYYNDAGEAMKRFSIRDGKGTGLLRDAGVETVIISGEDSLSIRRRSEKLHMRWLYLGIANKADHVETILHETGLQLSELAYIGDDVNDLEIIRIIGADGLTGAPGDAMPQVAMSVHYRCKAEGGYGAFREFADWILRHRR